MKKLSTILVLTFIALFFVAFSATNSSKTDGDDNPNYKSIKASFWDSYQLYNSNKLQGINTSIPVDQTGTFYINETGNFSLKHPAGVQSDNIFPRTPERDVVSTYSFTQSTTTYTSINTTGTVITSSYDDDSYYNLTLPFTFTYNGSPFTALTVTDNGWACLGAQSPYDYSPICDGFYPNVIAVFGRDLLGNFTPHGMYYQTTGVAPNRVYTIEWYHWGIYSGGLNEIDFQLKLYETTNAIDLTYKPETPSTTVTNVQVGLMGTTNADFATRNSATSWATTTAGTACSYLTFSPTIYPASGLTFTYAPPAPPVTPTLMRPVYGAVGRPQYDTLQWSPSAGATAYNLQLATDTTFATIIFSDTTMTSTAYVIGQFSPLATYWWRVRAKNAIGWSAFTPGWKFKVMGAASVPTLYTPANNATNQPVAFTTYWGKAVDLTSKPGPIHIFTGLPSSVDAIANYWYELYSDTTQTAVVKDSTLTDTSRAISGLLNNQNYWWRVKAKNNVGWGSFSAYFKFTTVVAAPAPPTNMAPPNNSTDIIPTALIDWSTGAGATAYKLQISADSTFGTTVLDSTTSVDSLRIPAGRLTNNTKYYWHVRSQNVGGNSAYTATWHFTTSIVGITNNGGVIPKSFNLYQAYPNPFNPSATIKFDLPKSSNVKMEIFNTLGQVVATLVNGNIEAGSYSVTWDAANFSSGVYFYRISAGDYTNIRKMVLMK